MVDRLLEMIFAAGVGLIVFAGLLLDLRDHGEEAAEWERILEDW